MCLFNPCNSYEVGVLFADGSAVRVHRALVILDKVQTNYSDCKPKASCSQIQYQLRNHKQNDELVKKTTKPKRFKTFSWEIENIVMTSSNYGTISLCLLRSINIEPVSASLNNSLTISSSPSASPSWEILCWVHTVSCFQIVIPVIRCVWSMNDIFRDICARDQRSMCYVAMFFIFVRRRRACDLKLNNSHIIL